MQDGKVIEIVFLVHPLASFSVTSVFLTKVYHGLRSQTMERNTVKIGFASLTISSLILLQKGAILQLFVVNKSIIVLNKAEDANILLNKRGANYSDRPRTILQGEM